MEVDVPDEFVEVLKNIEREILPENVVDWLEWASKNPEEAKRLAETYGRLSWCGRHKFAVCLWCGESPDYAIKSAVEEDEKHRSKRSILSKAIINAKKGGYKFTMPNGVECTVVLDRGEGAYWFRFKVAEEEIGIMYRRRGLWHALEAWRNGYASKYGIDAVSYKGKIYNPYADAAEMLIRAVEENVKPEVLATVNL